MFIIHVASTKAIDPSTDAKSSYGHQDTDYDDTKNSDVISWLKWYDDDDEGYYDDAISQLVLLPQPSLTSQCIQKGGHCVSAISCPVVTHDDGQSGPIGVCDGLLLCCLDYEVVVVKAIVNDWNSGKIKKLGKWKNQKRWSKRNK